jgi:hypothetical protein
VPPSDDTTVRHCRSRTEQPTQSTRRNIALVMLSNAIPDPGDDRALA